MRHPAFNEFLSHVSYKRQPCKLYNLLCQRCLALGNALFHKVSSFHTTAQCYCFQLTDQNWYFHEHGCGLQCFGRCRVKWRKWLNISFEELLFPWKSLWYVWQITKMGWPVVYVINTSFRYPIFWMSRFAKAANELTPILTTTV